MTTGPIDAVITWVDGNDPEHQRKRTEALSGSSNRSMHTIPAGQAKTRFLDNGELQYCICSIRRFAPWIRYIHLITDNQIPAFLTASERTRLGVRIVDHRDIFASFEWALPTFNSRSIETAIWRTPELASRFIYFNDDFLITRPVEPTDFFSAGKVVLRGEWKPLRNYGAVRIQLNRVLNFFTRNLLGVSHTMHLLLQARSAQLAGMKKEYFRAPHIPHPIRKETLEEFFRDHPETFAQNISYPFRDIWQFSGIYLANHLEILNRNVLFADETDSLMINGELDLSTVVKKKLQKLHEGQEVTFLCLQSLEKLHDRQRVHLEKILKERLIAESSTVSEH
ncbi:MAG: stealth family protein [Balneolaceae bacterium]